MYYLISAYYLIKAFLFLFLCFLFMPLAMINPYWFANGLHEFVVKLIDDLHINGIISKEQAEKEKSEFGDL